MMFLGYGIMGVSNAGQATTIYCSNLSQNPVNVQVRAFHANGLLAGTAKIASIGGGDTAHFSTHDTAAFGDVVNALNTGIMEGRARIFSEVPNPIVCAADVVDAAGFPPSMIAPRRMIRHPRGTSGGED